MSIQWLVERITEIAKLDLAVREAKIRGRATELKDSLAKALAQSCLLFEDILGSQALGQDSSESVEFFKKAKGEGKLADFFNVEWDLLQKAGLKREIIVDLMGDLEQAIEKAAHGSLPTGFFAERWPSLLTEVKDLVCSGARQVERHLRWYQYLRMMAAPGAGALIILVNLSPPVHHALPPDLATHSVSAGHYLLHFASDFLSRFLPD